MKQRFYPLLVGLLLYSFFAFAQDTTLIANEVQDSIVQKDTNELYWKQVTSILQNGILMIHATHRKGIVIDNLQKAAYYRVRYVTAKRPEINKT